MKNLLLTTICIFIYIGTFAQFGGGTGTESDPYRIYTIEHWNEFAEEYNNPQSVYGDFSGIHLRLMENINDTIINIRMVGYIPSCDSYKEFNGHLHGGGHTLNLSMPQYGESFQWYWLKSVGEAGTIDSIDFRGKISSKCMSVIVETNYGHISYCTMDFDCSAYRPDDSYSGICQYNLGAIEYVSNYTEIPMGGAFIGICDENHEGAIISHCINYAAMNPKEETAIVAGISHINYGGTIEYCMNVGDINNVRWEAAGILVQNFSVQHESYDDESHVMVVDTIMRGLVRNCINLGNMQCVETNNVMKGAFVAENTEGLIQNCFNVGNANGYITDDFFLENDTVPIGVIGYADNSALNINYTIENCLNVGNTSGVFINVIISNNEENRLTNNYFDKQMCGGLGNDTANAIESRLTMQITGETPELRDMLGDGWSYAEGRYPIPLGLENDSLAMLFATPIYLRVINDDNYDHTNLVRNNFTVGTENGVSWSSGDRLSIDGENATILASGSETATASLAGYSFSRSLRLDPITGELVATDCDSYSWNGDEYTASGDYIQVLTAANGCDSIVTLHLTINNSVHYSFTETATSPYIWNGTEYTETGDYTQNFTSANGCDSIVTLHLNILSGISQNGTAEISVFPTPVTDILNITSSETISEIEIVNTLGQVVKSIEVNSDSAVCNVEDLKAGVYVVRISTALATLSQRRFVKE